MGARLHTNKAHIHWSVTSLRVLYSGLLSTHAHIFHSIHWSRGDTETEVDMTSFIYWDVKDHWPLCRLKDALCLTTTSLFTAHNGSGGAFRREFHAGTRGLCAQGSSSGPQRDGSKDKLNTNQLQTFFSLCSSLSC